MTDVATVAQLRPVPAASAGVDILASAETFAHMQRVAKVFCASALIPDHLKKNNGADALLALQIAKRMNEDPVSVMQNIYFVSGKAGWSASYMIARANRSGVFKGPIRWKSEGAGDDLVVTARGRLADIEGEDVEVSVSMKMARAEGWTKNSKYNTMPEHMLRWRSATMLIRLYCPEVMMGMPTEDELTDARFSANFRDVTSEGHVTTADSVGSILSGSAVPHTDEPDDGQAATSPAAAGGDSRPEATSQPATSWAMPDDIIGQDKRMQFVRTQFMDQAETVAEIDAIVAEHAEFIAKLGSKKANFEKEIADRRLTLGGAQ